MRHIHVQQLDKSLRQPHVNQKVPRPRAIEGYPERAQRPFETMTHVQLVDAAKSRSIDVQGLSRAQLLKNLNATFQRPQRFRHEFLYRSPRKTT
jgi:hypothetical protein